MPTKPRYNTGMNTINPSPPENKPARVQIIVPVYNEQDVLPVFMQRIHHVLDHEPVHWSVLFVNDGSSDNTLSQLQQMHRQDKRVGYINLSRNFGKEHAMTAGLDLCDADAVVIMDVDLQDPPELIPDMLREWRNGFDVVYATRRERHGESPLKKATAHGFYRLLNAMGEIPIPKDTGDFRLLSRRAVTALRQLRERNRFMKGLYAWIGYPQKSLLFDRDPRAAGNSKWNFAKLWRFAIDGITAFSTVPLRFATWIGLGVAAFAFFYGLVIIIKTLIHGSDVPGYPSLMTVILFLGGIQLMAIGVIGEYLGRMFSETKQRPLYLIESIHPADNAEKTS